MSTSSSQNAVCAVHSNIKIMSCPSYRFPRVLRPIFSSFQETQQRNFVVNHFGKIFSDRFAAFPTSQKLLI